MRSGQNRVKRSGVDGIRHSLGAASPKITSCNPNLNGRQKDAFVAQTSYLWQELAVGLADLLFPPLATSPGDGECIQACK